MDCALTKGYKVVEVHEIWHFTKTAEYRSTLMYPVGLFGGYVDALLKIKQESSDWLQNVSIEEEKDRFVADYKEREGE